VLTGEKPQTPGVREQRAHHDKRSGGLVHPSVPFEQVPDYNAAAEQRNEDVDRNDRVVVRDPESAGFEISSQIQPHVATSADPQPQATPANRNTNSEVSDWQCRDGSCAPHLS